MNVKARQVDKKRRVILPPEIEPGTDVLIQKIDDDNWLITRHREQKKIKIVHLPVLMRLPDDPSWDQVESAFTDAAVKNLHRPDFD